MNYVESLLQTDKAALDERQTKLFKSRRLARILGKSEPVDIKLQQIPSRRANEIVARQFDKKGNYDMSKVYDAKLLLIVEGVVDPPMKNADVREHFGAASPAELAEKLFDNEVPLIAREVSTLAGVELSEDEAKDAEDAEAEVKN
jgi:hypothetical protein